MLARDAGILLLSVCALFLSLQHEGAYQFRKAWCARWPRWGPHCFAASGRRLDRRRAAAGAPEPRHPAPLRLPASRYHKFSEQEHGAHEIDEHAQTVPPPIVVRVPSRCWLRSRRTGSSWQLVTGAGCMAGRAVVVQRPCASHTLLPPSQTDLNGDGKPEILTATPDGRLQLLAPRKFGDGFARAEVGG